MQDRIISGFLAGIVASISMNIIDWAGHLLGFYQERLLNWAAVALYGRLPANTPEIVLAQIGQIIFAGFLAIPFIYLLPKLTSGNYIVKGWIFGLIIWFGVYALSIAFRLPHLEQHAFFAVVSHLISASVYGVVLGMTLSLLDQRKGLLP